MSLPIEIDKIIIRKRHRKVNHTKVAELAESINQVGLINPITLNGRTLLAGAHRLEAYKLLGFDRIPYSPCGINGDDDTNTLIEIDENLFRNELSAAEKAQHISERVEIMTRKKLPEKLKESKEAYAKRQKVDGLQVSDKVYHKVAQGAERAALSESKKEISNIMGTNTTNISADIRDHKAVTDAGLDQNKLEELKGVQYKRVAQVAREQGTDAAKTELEQQLNKTKNEGSNNHDYIRHLKQDINILVSSRSIIKRRSKEAKGKIEPMFYEDAFDSIDTLIEHLREKIN